MLLAERRTLSCAGDAMNKQLTIRGLDASLDTHLRAEAQRRRLSLNRTVLQLLRESIGLETVPPSTETAEAQDCSTDLDHLAGTWPPAEADALNRALKSMRHRVPRLC